VDLMLELRIAGLVWLLSLLLGGLETTALAWFNHSLPLTAWAAPLSVLSATTFNLWHTRRVYYAAGAGFALRVNEVLAARLAEHEARLLHCEKGVEDVKDAQIKIAGIGRGRTLPL
jgi:hypothetical protein